MEIIKVTGLSCRYPDQKDNIFTDIDLSIEEGSFVIISGASGSGKSTLLKMMKKELMPQCRTRGSVKYKGIDIRELDGLISSSQIGFVMQNPHMQPVTDTVWHELVFGLENTGADSYKIRKSAAETAGYFGLASIYRKKISELSGGQKQLVNLAAVMIMKPSVLLLDEPVSQLDPIAADNFISIVKKINRELGITVIIAEHHLDRVIDAADRIVVLEKGKVIFNDAPSEICSIYHDETVRRSMKWMPVPVQIFDATGGKGRCPLSVKELGKYIRDNFGRNICEYVPDEYYVSDDKIIELRDVWFRYEKNSCDILRGLDIEIYRSEFICILGGNGTGKTTLLGILSGILRAYKGNIKICGKKIGKYISSGENKTIAYLPQDPQLLFSKDRLYDDLLEITDSEKSISDTAQRLGLTELFEKHPYDLSGGEQQKAAIAKLLLQDPDIILLDEPTKGLDAEYRETIGKILQTLCSHGKTIIMSTHDLEFAAQYAHRCAMIFDGECACAGRTYDFFRDNDFYTTCSASAVRGYYSNVLRISDAVGMCLKNEKK